MPTFRITLALLLTSVVLTLPKAQAQTYSLLHAFSGTGDGGGPMGQPILDAKGNLYGATNWGGISSCPNPGCGLIFKLDPSGVMTVLHYFKGQDGANPWGNMVYDGSGNLYGVTVAGGALTDCLNGTKPEGCGVIYKLNGGTGKLTVLYRFTGGTDGAGPNSLTRDAQGNLYGTTGGGGMSGCGNYFSCGTIFKLDTTGKFSVLYSFTGGTDGGFPFALVTDKAGNLYGTTNVGGLLTCNHDSGYGAGCGTIFELTAAGNFKVLHAFGGKDGEEIQSNATLLLDNAGNLYSTTPYGGTPGCSGEPGCGLIYRMSSTGKETVLTTFGTGNFDAYGQNPYYGLTYDGSNNLYTTTTYGGDPIACFGAGCGTVDQMNPAGFLTVLYTFQDNGDGYYPTYLTSDSAGNLYGETVGGGVYDASGTIFKITR